MTYKIKLQPGDYCRRDMGEDKYREVVQRFMDDLSLKSDEVEFIDYAQSKLEFFGVTMGGDFCHSMFRVGFLRELTHEQVMEKSEKYKKLEQNYDAYKAAITNKQEKETMTEPDWKTAPEGATHFFKDLGSFYKKDAGSWFRYNMAVDKWMVSDDAITFCDAFISRPTPAWHETGDLPPAGTECEFFIPNHISKSASLQCESGSRVDILFHFTAQGRNVAAYKFLFDGEVRIDYAISDCFRPIKSDRDKAIEEMVKGLSYPYGDDNHLQLAYNFAEQVYDAGFRGPDEKLNSELAALRLSLDNSEKLKSELVEVVNELLVNSNYLFKSGEIANNLYVSRKKAKELLDSMEQK